MQLSFEKSKCLVFQGPSDILVTQYLQNHLGINSVLVEKDVSTELLRLQTSPWRSLLVSCKH